MADLTLKTYECRTKASSSERTVTARISTVDVDRDGDVILPSGLDAADFRANPVVLFAHGHDAKIGTTPIGRVQSLRKQTSHIEAVVKFAERPAEHPPTMEWVPDTIFSLFKQKVLNAFSVGFLVSDARAATTKDRGRFGEKVRQIITKWHLAELSVAPVPANPNALATAVSKGIFLPDSWIGKALDAKMVDDTAPDAVSFDGDEGERFVMLQPLTFDN